MVEPRVVAEGARHLERHGERRPRPREGEHDDAFPLVHGEEARVLVGLADAAVGAEARLAVEVRVQLRGIRWVVAAVADRRRLEARRRARRLRVAAGEGRRSDVDVGPLDDVHVEVLVVDADGLVAVVGAVDVVEAEVEAVEDDGALRIRVLELEGHRRRRPLGDADLPEGADEAVDGRVGVVRRAVGHGHDDVEDDPGLLAHALEAQGLRAAVGAAAAEVVLRERGALEVEGHELRQARGPRRDGRVARDGRRERRREDLERALVVGAEGIEAFFDQARHAEALVARRRVVHEQVLEGLGRDRRVVVAHLHLEAALDLAEAELVREDAVEFEDEGAAGIDAHRAAGPACPTSFVEAPAVERFRVDRQAEALEHRSAGLELVAHEVGLLVALGRRVRGRDRGRFF